MLKEEPNWRNKWMIFDKSQANYQSLCNSTSAECERKIEANQFWLRHNAYYVGGVQMEVTNRKAFKNSEISEQSNWSILTVFEVARRMWPKQIESGLIFVMFAGSWGTWMLRATVLGSEWSVSLSFFFFVWRTVACGERDACQMLHHARNAQCELV